MTAVEIDRAEKINSSFEIKLYHFDGREWQGTNYEFYKTFGKQLSLPKENSSCLGWFLNKKVAEKYFNKKVSASHVGKKLIPFENIKTKDVHYYSVAGFARSLSVSKDKVNDLVLGKTSQLKGYKLSKEFINEKRKPNRTNYKFKFINTGLVCIHSIPEMAKIYGIPKNRLYSLVKGKVKIIKKNGLTLA